MNHINPGNFAADKTHMFPVCMERGREGERKSEQENERERASRTTDFSVSTGVCEGIHAYKNYPLTKEIRLKILHPIISNSFLLDIMGFLVQIYLISHNIHPKAG